MTDDHPHSHHANPPQERGALDEIAALKPRVARLCARISAKRKSAPSLRPPPPPDSRPSLPGR